MQINQIIWIAEHSATGRYIGAGRDKSGPTAVRIISFIYIIAPTADDELSRNTQGVVNGYGTPVGPRFIAASADVSASGQPTTCLDECVKTHHRPRWLFR